MLNLENKRIRDVSDHLPGIVGENVEILFKDKRGRKCNCFLGQE